MYKNLVHDGINDLSTGAGFLSSHQQYDDISEPVSQIFNVGGKCIFVTHQRSKHFGIPLLMMIYIQYVF